MSWDTLSWEAKRGAVLAQALFVCEICGDAEAKDVDHIWPRSEGGSDDRRNLRAACKPCNQKKGTAIWKDDLDADPGLLWDGVIYHSATADAAVANAVRYTVMHWLLAYGSKSAHQANDLTLDVASLVAGDVQQLIDSAVEKILEPFKIEVEA